MGLSDDGSWVEGDGVGMNESRQHKSPKVSGDDPDDDPDDDPCDDFNHESYDDSDDASFEEFDEEEFKNDLKRRYQAGGGLLCLQSSNEKPMESLGYPEVGDEDWKQMKAEDAGAFKRSVAHRYSAEDTLQEWRRSSRPDEVSDDESLDTFSGVSNGEGTIGILTLRDRSMMKQISMLTGCSAHITSSVTSEDSQSIAELSSESSESSRESPSPRGKAREQDAAGKRVRGTLMSLQSISERAMENLGNLEVLDEDWRRMKAEDASAHRSSVEEALQEWRQSSMPDEVSGDESLDTSSGESNGEGMIDILTLRDRSMMRRISMLSESSAYTASSAALEDLWSVVSSVSSESSGEATPQAREQDAAGKRARGALMGLQSISERAMENLGYPEVSDENWRLMKAEDASERKRVRALRSSVEDALQEWRRSSEPDQHNDESLDTSSGESNGEGMIDILTLRDRSMMRQISTLSELDGSFTSEDSRNFAELSLESSGKLREQEALGKLAALSEERLRETFSFQVERGEEHFEARRYSMAKASFNNAKLALLVLSVISDEEHGKNDLDAAACFKLRNEIDLALLLERIADCESEEVLCGGTREDHCEEGDSSRTNYHQAVDMLVDARMGLVEGTRPRSGAAASLVDLEDLEREAVLSLARVYSKQGRVYAKLNNQQAALDSFEKAITSWEVADSGEESPELEVSSASKYDIDEALILETQNDICSCHEDKRYLSPITRSLRNATNFDMLATAFEMASSHYGLGYKALEDNNNKEAIDHCLCALELVRRARGACSTHDILPRARRSSEISVGAAVSAMSRRHGVVARIGDGGTPMTQCDPKGREENAGSFVKKCALLQTKQEMCISRASFRMGALKLSQKWLSKALTSIGDLRLHSNDGHDAEVARYVLSLLMRNDRPLSASEKKEQSSTDLFSLYEDGVTVAMAMPGGYKEKPRLMIHHALALLEKGLHVDALDMLNQAMTDRFCSSPNPPTYFVEVLGGVDAQIIIQAKQGNMAGALVAMNRRLDMVSRWIGNYSIERARDFHRLACFESLFGNHPICATCLERALLIGSDYEEFDTLESIKLLATTREVLNDFDGALRAYELAMIMEKRVLEKARLMNAMAHLHTKNDARCHLSFELLDKSLECQQEGASREDHEHVELLMETTILYGNAMVMKSCFAPALLRFEAALNSNPDKDPIQPNNLRSWYNKGVTLFRSGDIIGAGHAFGIILDKADKSPVPARGAAFVFNAIGNIYFANEDYLGAIECFNRSLGARRCPFQRAGALCNIAMTNHQMGNYEESESNFAEAMRESKFTDEDSFVLGESGALRAAIMSKFAFALYKRKLYLRAYELYLEVAEMGDNEISGRYEAYAETCRLKHLDEDSADALPKPIHEVTPQIPTPGENLIFDAARYRDAVYSSKQKLRVALGVEIANGDALTFSSDYAKIPYGTAVEKLMKQSESFRVSYASDFMGLLAETLNSKFMIMESLLENELTDIDEIH